MPSMSAWMIFFLLSTRLTTSRSFVLETAKNQNLSGQFGLTTRRRTTGVRRGPFGSFTKRIPMVSNSIDTEDGTTVNSSTLERRFPVSNRIVDTLDPCVVKTKEWMGKYAHLWEGDKGGIFSLAQGVVYWKPPPACRKALVDAINADSNADDQENEESDPLALHSYSPARGLPELLEALEAKIDTEHGMSNHDVTVTVGANQAYTNIVLTLLGSGAETNKAVVFAPYYFNHVMAIQMCAGPEAVVVGPTNMDTGVPDIDWLRRLLSEHQKDGENEIRMVTLVNPGNPTGVALSREIVQEIVDVCKEHGVWVVLDCTYEHFFNNGEMGDSNPLPTFPDESHVIHVFSFSKGYAMAGYRCGYLVTHKDDASKTKGGFLEQMLKVQDTIPIGPPRLSQHVAIGALKQGAEMESSEPLYSPSSKEWVYDKYATLEQSRNYILDALSVLPQQIGGTGSMYVMGKLPDNLSLSNDGEGDEDEPIDVLFCRLLVKEYGIAIIPGSFCGSEGWIRICYANLPPDEPRLHPNDCDRGSKTLRVYPKTIENFVCNSFFIFHLILFYSFIYLYSIHFFVSHISLK